MPKASERTLQMRANYLKLHQEGLSPRQIAAHYNLAPAVVYNNLSRIAQEAGVSRESLLQRPSAQNTNTPFTQHANAILTQLDQLQQLIAQDIADQTTLANYFTKETASWQPV